MSTSTVLASQDRAEQDESAAGRPVTFPRVVRSEWIKFRSLRSTWAVLALAVLAVLVLAVVIGSNTRHLTGNQDANDLVPSSPLQGSYLSELLIGALGVLFVSGEFSTGMIRSTFAAVPRRLPVLWAKLAVFVSITAVSMIGICVVAFLVSQAIIGHYRTGYSLGSPTALRVVIGTGVYLTLVGVIGAMIGWIVRSTPGAIVAYATVVLVLPALFGNFLQHWGQTVNKFLPVQAGQAFDSSLPDAPHLSPWAGVAVLVGWTVLSMAVAAVTLRRRDA